MFFTMNVSANAQETSTLLLFGDSLVAGYGVEHADSLPSQLEEALQEKGWDVKVINGGVSGDTTAGGRSRLAWMLKKHQPDQVLLALGGNDILRGVPPKVTRENIFAMLEILQEGEYDTVLSAVRAPRSAGESYQKEFDAIYPDAASHFDISLYPFFLEDTYGKADLMQPDGIHPNAKGAQIIATKLAEFLLKLRDQRESRVE